MRKLKPRKRRLNLDMGSYYRKKRKPKIKIKKRFKPKLQEMEEQRETHIEYEKKRCEYILSDGKRCRRNAMKGSVFCSSHITKEEKRQLLIEKVENAVVPEMISGKYDPNFHPFEYIKLAKEGMSQAEIAAEFGVSVGTLRKWTKYVDFAKAVEIGDSLHEAWWIRAGKDGLHDARRFNTALYKFMTGNLLGYSEKIESKNFNANMAGVLLVPGQMSPEEWEKMSSKYKKKTAERVKKMTEGNAEKDFIEGEFEEVD